MALNNAPSDPKAKAGPEGHPLEDVVAAAIFIVIGVVAFYLAQDYRTGTLHRMGPGLFPLLISGSLTVIGIALGIQSLAAWRKRDTSDDAPSLIPGFATMRALFFVMLSLLAFAVLVRPAGLFIATASLVFISTRAEPGRSVVRSLFLAFVIACISAAIFVYGIGLPMPLWPN